MPAYGYWPAAPARRSPEIPPFCPRTPMPRPASRKRGSYGPSVGEMAGSVLI